MFFLFTVILGSWFNICSSPSSWNSTYHRLEMVLGFDNGTTPFFHRIHKGKLSLIVLFNFSSSNVSAADR